jgi:hypothetical protein
MSRIRQRATRNRRAPVTDNAAMLRLRAAVAAVLLAAGCLPDTHLTDERHRPRAAPPPATAIPDDQPPHLGDLALMPAGDCIRLRVTSDKPASVVATLRTASTTEERPLGSGGTLFDLALRPETLAPGEPATAVVVAQDDDGRRSAPSLPAEFRVPSKHSDLAITELMINPAGSEASQEYVEIRNLGAQPFALAHLRLEDDAGADEVPAVELAPGASALIVPGTYDPGSTADAAPAPGTPLLRVEGRLGRDGLRQSGEVVRLVGADGTPLSSYGGWVDASRPGWQGRSVHRTPDPAACDHPRSWSDSPLPPTPGW